MTSSEEQACLQHMVKEGRAFAELREENQALKRENEELKRWKAEMLTLQQWWQSVDEAVRANPSARLGYSVAQEAKRLIEERENALRHASVLHGLLAQNLTFAPSPQRNHLCREAIKAFLHDFPS